MTKIKKGPLVSVLLPVYNAGSYLKYSIESILKQTHDNFELIVVDDGCTDGCIEENEEILRDERIILIRQKNAGKAVALNKALEMIRGKYWMIQDADDVSMPERIEVLLEIMEQKNNIAAVYSGHRLIVGSEEFSDTFQEKNEAECRNLIIRYAMPAHDATGLYRAEMIRDYKFDPCLRVGQGVDFVLRVGYFYPVFKVGACLYCYRINYNSTIRKDPSKNVDKINSVIRKNCRIRNDNYESYKLTSRNEHKTKKRSKNNHVVTHSMESVLDYKRCAQKLNAIIVGIKCIKLNPLDFYFWKPLLYGITPLFMINTYRSRRMKNKK